MAEKFRTESFPVQLKRSSSVFMDSSFNEEPLSKRPRYAVSSLYHAVNNIRNAAPKSYPENVTQSLNISEEARCVTFNEGLEQFNSRKQKLLTLKDKNILKKCYHEDLAELFFLQNLGHLITEFPTWRKKTDIQLSQFYQANPLDRSNRNGHAESDALGEKELLRPFHFPVEKASSGPPTPTRKSATEPPKSDDETNEPSAVNEIAEQARKEAEVIKKVHNLRKQGLWSKSRLPKCMEPKRTKTHWDYLLEEMQWMAADFHSEAKLKIQHAKRQARAVQAYWASFRDNEKRNEKKKEIQLKRLANGVAKMIKNFWQVMEKFADMKQRNRLEETRIKALNVHLNHIIDKTQTYSSMLTCSVGSGSVDDPDKNDTEYNPEEEDSEDDITTLAQEEEKLNKTEVNQELKALTAESDMPLDQLMSKLPKSYFAKRRRLSSFSEESDVEMLTPDEDEEASNQQMEQQTKAKLTVDYAEASDEFSVAETLIPKGEIEGRCLTRVPTLLKGQLREYQHVGLDWLASLHRSNLNGILADEMGLGKTIQTIALLAHLAEAYGDWGPHLIVVPTSVIINWEFELKKWCPAFKVVSYYGSIKDRRSKRSGWTKDNAFHVLITSYKLVVQDHSSFRRMKWKYFILDEAQNIKNFKSQRWQMLLNLKSKNRLLLTGTPIQNSLMELWSLLHFLMPHIFDSHNDFREWFSAPLTSMVEGSRKFSDSLVTRLHKVLRPFLLRRLKKDVEKQMPMKHEHVVLVDLSRRQRYLYDEFMSLSDTKRQIDSGSFMSIMNILMQLRKVCNHPQLFDPRPVLSPFKMKCLSIRIPYLFVLNMERKFLELPLLPTNTKIDGLVDENGIVGGQMFSDKVVPMGDDRRLEIEARDGRGTFYTTPDVLIRAVIHRITRGDMSLSETLDSELMTKLWLEYYNSGKPTNIVPFRHGNFIYAQRFVAKRLKIKKQINKESDTLKKILSVVDDYHVSEVRHLEELIMYLPECLVPPPELQIKSSNTNLFINTPAPIEVKEEFGHWHLVWRNFQLQFPETRWVQYDSGKLQVLAMLLKKLKSNGHRTLIFTQMTKMLDVLEMFLSYHGYTYLRLDGTTKVDMRHSLMERFNQDTRIFCFILSTRSGGIGVNLTGADTVIFYDSDWNPTMDAQAQDRCHRIGQTKDVHIYRLICKHTVEENILKKANQKRLLSHVAIEGGNFTTASFKQSTVREIFNIPTGFSSDLSLEAQTEFLSENKIIQLSMNQMEEALTMVEDESDVKAAKSLRVEVDNEGNEFQDENEEGEAKEAADAISAELNKMKEQTSELEKDCTPIERWCVKLIEDKYKDVYEEELKTAKEEVELAQKELEQSQEDAMITALAKQLEKEQEEIENHFHTEDQVPAYIQRALMLPGRAGFCRKSRQLYKSLGDFDNSEDNMLKLFKKHNKYPLYVACWTAEAERSDNIGEEAKKRLEEIGERIPIPQPVIPKVPKMKKKEEILSNKQRRGRGRPRKLETTTKHELNDSHLHTSSISIPSDQDNDTDDVTVVDEEEDNNNTAKIAKTKINTIIIPTTVNTIPKVPTVVLSVAPAIKPNVIVVKSDHSRIKQLHPTATITPFPLRLTEQRKPAVTIIKPQQIKQQIQQRPIYVSIPVRNVVPPQQPKQQTVYLVSRPQQQPKQTPVARVVTLSSTSVLRPVLTARGIQAVRQPQATVTVSPLPRKIIQPTEKLILPTAKLRMPILSVQSATNTTVISCQTKSVIDNDKDDAEDRRRSGRSHKPTARLLQSAFSTKLLKNSDTPSN